MHAFRTFIVDAKRVKLANLVTSCLSKNKSNMFTAELSTTISGIVTNYIASGGVDEEFANYFNLQEYEQIDDSWVLLDTVPGNVESILQRCQEDGLSVTAEMLLDLIDSMDVTTQNPFVAMSRLNLVQVQSNE